MLFCQVCRGEVPSERARRKKARTCSDKCQAELRRQMGQERDRRICRLCGRRFRKPRTLALVNMDHSGILEASELVTH